MRSAAGIGLALCVGAAPASAAQGAALGTAALLRAGLSLALVVALIALCAWLLRRFGGAQLGNGGQLQLLASLPLSQRERLALVEVDGRRLLLGIAPGQVSLLKDCGEGESTSPELTAPSSAAKLPLGGRR